MATKRAFSQAGHAQPMAIATQKRSGATQMANAGSGTSLTEDMKTLNVVPDIVEAASEAMHEAFAPLDLPALPVDFDPEYYLFLHPDIAATGLDPVMHFLRWGMVEGRNYRRPIYTEGVAQSIATLEAKPAVPNFGDTGDWGFVFAAPQAPTSTAPSLAELEAEIPAQSEDLPADFEPFLYLRANPDVGKAKVDPVWHYLNLGRFEGRLYRTDTEPLTDEIDPAFILNTRPSDTLKNAKPMKDGSLSWPPMLYRVGAFDLHKFRRNRALASYLYLNGNGIEVKAMSAPLPVRSRCKVTYLEDIATQRLLKKTQRFACLPTVKPHIIDDTDEMSRLDDASRDFMILNNSLHFSENVIGSLRNAMRIIRPGGVVYASVIDKRYSVDVRRQVTPLQHFWEDFNRGPEISRTQHYWDFWNHVLVPISGEAGLQERGVYVTRMIYERRPIHFHTFTHGSFIGLVQSVIDGLAIDCELELAARNEIETICIIRKNKA